MIGKTISHYRIEAVLGRGGMGVVHRATEVNRNRAMNPCSRNSASRKGRDSKIETRNLLKRRRLKTSRPLTLSTVPRVPNFESWLSTRGENVECFEGRSQTFSP